MDRYRLTVYSDVHYPAHTTSWEPWYPPPALDVDAIVLTGDVHGTPGYLGAMVRRIRDEQRPETAIVVVPGNGEYIGQELAAARAAYASEIGPITNTYWLDDAVITLANGLRFIGSTLWADFTEREAEQMTRRFEAAGFRGVDDVSVGDRFLTLDDTRGFHRTARALIERTLRGLTAQERRSTIVCTHFWPRLTPIEHLDVDLLEATPQEREARLFDRLITEAGPAFWLVGHMHVPLDAVVGGTRFVGNPRIGERLPSIDPSEVTYGVNPAFDERLVLVTT